MNKQILANFRKKMDSGGTFGLFMKTSDPAFVEAAGYAGCDFVILDMEHGPTGIESMQNNIRAAQLSGVTAIVRVPILSEEYISKALDIGASGIQVPQISDANSAKEAVKMAKFHPEGTRGVCRFVRAAKYSNISGEKYFSLANEALVIIQLEGKEAVNNIDEILKVKGLDVVFIGPYDLSQSLGVPGEIDHPEVIKLIETIVEKAKEYNINIGIFADSMEYMEKWIYSGVKYMAYSVDVGIFSLSCRDLKGDFLNIVNNIEKND